MKKFIIGLLCFIVWTVLMYFIYTRSKVSYNMLMNILGGWYLGVLIGKFVDWLTDTNK